MGMRLQYISLPGSAANKLRSNPDFVASLVMSPALAAMDPRQLANIQRAIQKGMAAMGFGSRFPRIVRYDGDADRDGDHDEREIGGTFGGGNGPSLARPDAVRGELEKAWHGLHFVFTGRSDEAPPPLGYLLSGGEEVGEDLGYGAARLLNGAEVKAFRDALHAIDARAFDARFDVAALARHDVYPSIWDEDRDELLEEYEMYFEQLKSDLDRVVAAGEYLLIAIV
jgi:hypothetical protein